MARPRHLRHKKPRASSTLTGTLLRHRNGYGFLQPDQPDRPDVYISRYGMGDAMHGDLVEIRVREKGRRQEGEVVRVIERVHSELVGYFNGHFVAPRDERIGHWVRVLPGKFGQAEPGDVVVVRIVHYPSGMSGAEGEITEVLGREDDPAAEAVIVLREHGFLTGFGPQSEAEARRAGKAVKKADLLGREDLRHLPFVTVDPEDARDHDDAVAVEREREGFRLYVAIADVSHYVTPGSSLDREAFERATSVYFPDRAFPMLPETISAGIASLQPDKDRLVLVAELHLDRSGRRQSYRFYAAVIRSRHRLSYTQVHRLMEARDPALRKELADVVRDLEAAYRLAKLRIQVREKRGSIELDIPEGKVIFGPEGQVENIVRSERTMAHRMVEEFMLAANEAVAEFMTEAKVPFLYRIHEPPDPKAVETLAEFLQKLGLRLLEKNQDPEQVKPANYQRLIRAAERRPEARLVSMLALRSMMRAIYSPKNKGHFGLAAECYTHFTSPIRRYPDLIVHRLLKRQLGVDTGRGPAAPGSDLSLAAAHCSERERAATEAEREMEDLFRVRLMASHLGETYSGIVSGVTAFGLFVELVEIFVEGLVPIESLDDDYVFEEKEYTLRGRNQGRRYRLGDPVTILVESVNLERRQITFRLLGQRHPDIPRKEKISRHAAKTAKI